MATNIGKALYPAPMGIDEGVDPLTPGDVGGEDTPDGELEIDIVNPDMVTLDDGSVEITIIPGGDEEDDEDDEEDEVVEVEVEGGVSLSRREMFI